MRTDLASMNPGKAMAQASHASNAFVKSNFDRIILSSQRDSLFEDWCQSTPQGFGTVLVLAVNEAELRSVAAIAKISGFEAGIVNDPSYPIRDGEVVHHINIDTCGWVFGDRRDPALRALLKNFRLHP